MLEDIHHFFLRKILALKLKKAGARQIKIATSIDEKSENTGLYEISFFSKMTSSECFFKKKSFFLRPYESCSYIFDYKDNFIYIEIDKDKHIYHLPYNREENSTRILELMGVKKNYKIEYKITEKLWNFHNHIYFSKFLASSLKIKEVLVFNFSISNNKTDRFYNISVEQYCDKIIFILNEFRCNQKDLLISKNIYRLKNETFYLEKGIFDLLKKEPAILEHLFRKELIEAINMLPDNIDEHSLKDFHALVDMLLV